MSIWNIYAKVYDVINQNIPYTKMQSDVINELDLRNDLKLLDAGCGTGNFAAKISEAYAGIKIVATDSSEEMLKQAIKKLAKYNIEIRNINLENKTEFLKDTFDRVVVTNTLYTLKNQQVFVEEFYRILKFGGKLVIANPDDQYSFKAIILAQLKELGWFKFAIKTTINLPALLVIIFINIFFIRKNKYYFLNKEELIKLLEKAGFTILKVQRTYADQDLLITALK